MSSDNEVKKITQKKQNKQQYLCSRLLTMDDEKEKEKDTKVIEQLKMADLHNFSRAGNHSNLVYFSKFSSQNSQITPQRHSASPQVKARRFHNLPQREIIKCTTSFQNSAREKPPMFRDQKNEKDAKEQKYNPKYQLVLPSNEKWTIPPLKQTQSRQRIFSPPECIIRGNSCTFQIRQFINNMRKQSEKVQSLQKKLLRIEKEIEKMNLDKVDYDYQQKKKKYEEQIASERRNLAEQLLEAEKQFQQGFNGYESSIERNLILMELKDLNIFVNYPQKHVNAIEFEKYESRKELFKKQNVADIEERLCNNFIQFSPHSRSLDDFTKQLKRNDVFKPKKTTGDYPNSKLAYEQINYDARPYRCLTNLKKSADRQFFNSPPKDQVVNEIDATRIIKGTKVQSHFVAAPVLTNYTKQLDRSIPSPMQMRCSAYNENYFLTRKANNYPFQLQVGSNEQQQKSGIQLPSVNQKSN